ncbi:MAG: ycnJ [Paenibacillaceae bacterium]|nr:ycnJ [Paenibacillaceae bacterium]
MSIQKIAALCLAFLMFGLFAALPQALAHAVLVQASPLQASELQVSPPEIRLTFNERLEKKLYAIDVVDSNGKAVNKKQASLSDDLKELSLPLSKLPDGYYTVTYRVISADGHPVAGAYVFTLGQPQAGTSPFSDPLLSADPHSGHGSNMQVEFWAVRIFFYAMLLMLCGWTFWSAVFRRGGEDVRRLHRYWSRHLLWFYLIAVVGVGLLQVSDLLTEASWNDIVVLVTQTYVGLSWIGSVALVIIGLALLQRWRTFDFVWAALLLAAKSFSGHAMAFDPPLRTVALDIAHLAAASVWVGGLFYFMVVGYKHPERRAQFLPVFSRAALISILVLVVSGLISTFIFIPKLDYLLFTSWGKLLIGKIVLVAGVVTTGFLLRRRLKKVRGSDNLAADLPMRLIRLDFALMLGIVGIVGIFTFLNPFPANEPIRWHVMGNTVHMSADVTPGTPGANEFTVQVWLPDKDAAPKQVLLHLTNKDLEGMGAIEVPLNRNDSAAIPQEAFTGFTRYDYSALGPYLAFPGKWTLEVRVMDAKDNESVYDKTVRIF